jgi:flavodoxin
MKLLLVVWASQTGGTLAMVEAFARGVTREVAGVSLRMLPAPLALPQDALGADLLVFATPENLASMAGAMKDFFDRSYYALLDRCNGKPYSSLICAGSDGTGAERQLDRIATGLRLRRVAQSLIVNLEAQSPERILALKTLPPVAARRCEELGATLAAGLAPVSCPRDICACCRTAIAPI